MHRATYFFLTLVFAAAAAPAAAASDSIPPSLYSDLRWRNIGPFRGGWSTCVAGIPDEPDVFYFGAAVGGVWRTDDAGRTWEPLFQNESAASIGALAIAPSDPKILYVGTGQVDLRYDIASGDGVYRSDDGGRTWRHLGLADTRAIGRLVIDQKNPDVVLAAALGHIFGPSRERGVYRTEDGGRNWKKTLFVDENTGAVDLAADPDDPSVVYAATWEARNFPWLSYFEPSIGPGSGVFKSTDGGKGWKRLSGGGWPEGPIGRIGLAAGRGGRVYAEVDAPASARGGAAGPSPRRNGLYRSDDGGSSWKWTSREEWLGGSYFGRITVDPGKADRLYAMGQSVRRSDDGGKSWEIVKGAPGGDDYHFLWVNPKHPDHMAVASDQGTVVTVNGAKSWSDWYNQPTGQFYHLAADDRFPYWIYSGQQDSGTVGIASRSDFGALSYREWRPVGGDERDYDIPDPADPDIVYGSGLGGSLARFDSRTGQVAAVSPHVESTYARRGTEVKYRYTWITPIAVSPRPPHAIYQGAQVLFRSTDRGQSWTVASPDLSGAVAGTKGCDGPIALENARPCGFGVIYSIALSPANDDEIWIGTDDGRIQMTRDGGKIWKDVTPRGLHGWSKVATLDISPLDPSTVYAAIDDHRRDDFTPHVYRTHDAGRSWSEVTAGFPTDGFVDVVRADPVRRGLLYAGTGAGVFVSFDDGDRWQPLKLNLPTTWVRDLLVHGDDLIAATQGRAIWILDDVTPLRQLTPAISEAPAHLFLPAEAYRLRRDENRDTPPPPETSLGKNPPAGAVIDYTIREEGGPVTLEILDARGEPVRRYSTTAGPEAVEAERYFAGSWTIPPALPGATAGHHRFVWDLRYPRPKSSEYEYSIAAVWGEDTPAEPEGALAPPGRYTVRLTAAGKTLTRPLILKMDPRAHISVEAIGRQFNAEQETASLMARSRDALEEVRAFHKALGSAGTTAAADLEKKAAALNDREAGFAKLNGRLTAVFRTVESADAEPTAQALSELESARRDLESESARWKELRGQLKE